MKDAISLNRTLLDMYIACPFTGLKEGESFSDELGERYCRECKFECFCCLPPDEWDKTLRSATDKVDEQENDGSNDEHETEVVLDTYCKQCNNEDCDECVLLDMFDEDDDGNGDDNSDGINMLQSISIVVEEGGIVNVNC